YAYRSVARPRTPWQPGSPPPQPRLPNKQEHSARKNIMMLKNPSSKYRAFEPVRLTDRTWPNKTITTPPIWMSTDLRDGNQALIDPMDSAKKLRFFEMLVN